MKIYYYSSKFPEYEIKEFEVTDISYITNKKDEEYIYSIKSWYNTDYENYETNENNYENYYYLTLQSYDSEIYDCDFGIGNLSMSFNKEVLEKKRIDDIKHYISVHGKHIDKCREILKKYKIKEINDETK